MKWSVRRSENLRVKQKHEVFQRMYVTDFSSISDKMPQVKVVAFMCTTVDTSFIFTKNKKTLQNVFLISVTLRWHSVAKN